MTNDLDDLEKKLAQFRTSGKTERDKEAEAERDAENMNNGIRAGTELIACIVAGVLIGLGLDKWLNTLPLFLIIFTLTGIGAGFMNVYRITQNIGPSIGFAELHNRKKTGKKTPENHSEEA